MAQEQWQITLNTGAKMPGFGLGTWLSPKGAVGAAVEEAVRAGYRHIDCAHIYGNEAEIGVALAKVFKEGIVKREDLFITSKLWNDSHAVEDVLPACQVTLKNLGIDYLDLYLIHWPRGLAKGTVLSQIKDEQVIDYTEERIKGTWGEMEGLVAKGLVKAIGISNFTITKTETLLKNAKIAPAVNQVESHPYFQQIKLKQYCDKMGIIMESYSPLGNPKRPSCPSEDPVIMDEPVLKEIAEELNATVAQICIAFQLHRGVPVIPKTVTKERIHENLAATSLQLSPKNMQNIRAVDRNFRLLRNFMVRSFETVEQFWDVKSDETYKL